MMAGTSIYPDEITRSGEKQMAIGLFRHLAYFHLKKLMEFSELNKLKFHVLEQALFHLQRAEESV